MRESDVEEIYEKIKEQEDSREKSTTRNIPNTSRTTIALYFGALVISLLLSYISTKTFLIFLVAGIFIIEWLYGAASRGAKELSERELSVNLYKQMRYKQTNPLGGHYQVDPSAKIKIHNLGRRVRINGTPQERIFGVEFFNHRTRKSEFFRAAMDLHTGDLVGFKGLPAGFRDIEDWDVKVIESEKTKDEKRYNDAMGARPRPYSKE